MRQRRHVVLGAALLAILVVLPALVETPPLVGTAAAGATSATAASTCGPQPPATAEPSGAPPLAPKVLEGWTRVYCEDFLGTSLPPGWIRFRGVPKGDPSGMWAPSHVVVQGGMLTLTTTRDAAYHDAWVTGGACLCGFPRKYGAFFVRSRLTVGGPASIQLLWPSDNSWPPEVDFYESWQYPKINTFTDHYASVDHKIQKRLKANMTKWHTWGVFWTPTTLEFVVDWGVDDWGVWGTLKTKGAIPSVSMTLDLQQQAWCSVLPGCPTKPSAMLVDWVTVFAPTTTPPVIPKF